MHLEQYQIQAHTTSVYPQAQMFTALMHRALGMASEAGEVCAVLNRVARDKHGLMSEADKAKLVLEAGDVLWMLADLCTMLGVSLEDVAQQNLNKLAQRALRDTLHGEGDAR